MMQFQRGRAGHSSTELEVIENLPYILYDSAPEGKAKITQLTGQSSTELEVIFHIIQLWREKQG